MLASCPVIWWEPGAGSREPGAIRMLVAHQPGDTLPIKNSVLFFLFSSERERVASLVFCYSGSRILFEGAPLSREVFPFKA
ncbi:MAG: hypothetical protein OXC07_12225 [Kistimonas sp.]|nr:hypothetical protein [Kistimonas sp.]